MQNCITGFYIVTTVLKSKQIIPYFPENIDFCVNCYDVSDVCDWVMLYIQNRSSVQKFIFFLNILNTKSS